MKNALWINDNMNNVAENILNKNLKNINTKDTELEPLFTNVILDFYEENPYRAVETTETGIILGIEGNKTYKSNETGEMEDSEEYIAYAKVIAVGKDCKYVNVGDDVLTVKHYATPIPYRNKNYRAINEQHIICKVVEK